MTTINPLALEAATHASDPGVDAMTVCDREAIHAPGAIQPHGALLALRASDLVILQASANARLLLGMEAQALLGQPVSVLLGDAQAMTLARLLETLNARGEARSDTPLHITLAVDGKIERFDSTLHRSTGAAVVLFELERAVTHDALSLYGFNALVRRTLARVRGATTLDTLAQTIAEQMRVITGYDRVWVYRFHEDWHGEIIAESRRAGVESWLGLHYPAADIPVQARALFLEHPLRVIADVTYTPSAMVPVLNPETGAPLDLGGAILRSVSPFYIEYMRNMKTQGSLVVSLLKDGQLWGLISGHHYSGPKFVPSEIRTVCEFLGQAFSAQLVAAERSDEKDRALRARSVEGKLVEQLARGSIVSALTAGATTIIDLVPCTGASIVLGSGSDALVSSVGLVPPEGDVRDLVEWLDTRAPLRSARIDGDVRDVASFFKLDTEYAAASAYRADASGLLAVRLGFARAGDVVRATDRSHGWLLWFRSERRQMLRWGGDPTERPVEHQKERSPRLSPMGSYDAWQEEVTGTATPWRADEHESAVALTQAVSVACRWSVTGAAVGEAAALATELRTAIDSVRLRLDDGFPEATTLDDVTTRLEVVMTTLIASVALHD